MQIIDLFSGIGGFSLAGHWAGWQTVQFCEIDTFCGRVLEKNFPGIPIHQDIKTLTRDNILENGIWRPSEPTIVVGGFPCQPYSHAGQRKGNDDDRALWPQMLRVIREVGPAWLVGENVAGLITMDGGRVLDGIFADLENAGYTVEAFIIPACAVGAPHRRDRVWIVAHRDSKRQQQPEGFIGDEWGRLTDGNQKSLTSDASCRGWRGGAHYEGQQTAERDGFTSDCVAPSDACCGRRNQTRTEYNVCGRESYINRPDWNEHWFPAATRICRVHDGIPRRVDRGKRLKALGNAIVPQVAYQIFQAIKSATNDY